MRRILTALFLVPPLLFVLLLAPAWAFLILAELAALEAAHEIAGLVERRGYRPNRLICYVAIILLVASFYPGVPGGQWWFLLVIPFVGSAAVWRGSPGPTTLGEVASNLLAVVYVGLSIGSMVSLRATPPDAVGRMWVFFLLAVVMLGDTAAYYTGSAVGKHALAPKISPKKTIEGLMGGLIVSVVAAAIAAEFLIPDFDWMRGACVGFGLAWLGVVGDLFESLLKRSAGVKDTSSIFPGHGGILDRIDSLLFAAPALLLYVRLFH